MLVLQNAYKSVFFLFLLCAPLSIYSENGPDVSIDTEVVGNEEINQSIGETHLSDQSRCKKKRRLSYYLFISDFINNFIEIPTSNVLPDSSIISSRYLAGIAPLYNEQNQKVGTCSASFLCFQNSEGIFTDISNYLSVDNGLIVTWFTPTTLINLELDSIVHSMVTECIVIASTKVGFNPFYGKKFNLVVSSDDQKIYFNFRRI